MRLPSPRDRYLWIAVAIGVTAIVLRIGYLRVTPFNVRDHDVGSLVEYVEYLLKHRSLPKSNDGFSFYHPAFYFIIAAIQWAVLAALHVAREGILKSLQTQSMVWQLGFALLSILTAKLWLDELPERNFGSGLWSRRALLAFYATLILSWPSTVIHGARIGNDDPVYFFFGASIYFMSRWWLRAEESREAPRLGDRDLNLSALAAAFGVITKTNALVLFPVLALLLLFRLAVTEKERRPARYLKLAWPIVAAGFISAGLALGTAVRDAFAGTRPSVLIGNAYSVSKGLAVGNGAQNYLWFDLQTFVTQPFSNPWDDVHGRQWFWNYIFKTSLFGEFQYDPPVLANLAVCISVVFLAIIAVFIVGLFLSEGEWRRELPLRLTAVVLVGSLALLRIRHPNSCSNDFRYVLPVLTPFLSLYVRSLSDQRALGRVRLAQSGMFLGWTFAALSVAFIGALDLGIKG